VNLEPCTHFGKTPPCTDLIIKKKIPRVFIGTVDPFVQVAGKGIKKLREAGCQVEVGLLEKEARQLNQRFFTFHEKQRPYIILKWAQTLDGFVDTVRDKNAPVQPTWITDENARMLVHKWRTEEQAILVGRRTAQKDNPRLNARSWPGKSPTRVLLAPKLNLPGHLHLFDQSIPTIVINGIKAEVKEHLEFVKINLQEKIPEQILAVLFEKKLQSVIVEGGPMLLNAFIERGLWDEARVFVGNILFHEGVKAPAFPNAAYQKKWLGENQLLVFENISE
jgi:diaminohydroxyphosphoribosylaminopyrimidine deaminase/5-amino-6-(5-phosphoribosylamino)uracil reductase